MKKIFAIIATVLLSHASASAQWSLEQCIDYAITNNIDVQQSFISAQEGEIDVTDAKDAFLPNLSGYASQSFNFGRGLTADNTYANRNTSSFSVGAQFSLPIFQGLRAIRRLDYSRTALRALLERTEEAKDNVSLNVMTQYLQALYAGEMLQVARINLSISQDELARRQALLEAGKIAELDIYEASAQVAQDELSVVNAENDSIIALLDLAQMLNLPSTDDFSILPLPDGKMPILNPGEVFANAMRNNHSIRAGRIEEEAAQKNISLAKAAYIPSLSFNAGVGTNYYKTSGFNNESFSQQMRHNFAKQIGFSLSVPIFDGFSTRNNVRRAHARAVAASLSLDDTRNRLYKSITQAYTQAVAAQKKQDAAGKTVESTRAAFDAMQVKYDNGRANSTEYSKAKSDYTNALANEVQAKYETILRSRILNFYNEQ